jgi:hypothetical protein
MLLPTTLSALLHPLLVEAEASPLVSMVPWYALPTNNTHPCTSHMTAWLLDMVLLYVDLQKFDEHPPHHDSEMWGTGHERSGWWPCTSTRTGDKVKHNVVEKQWHQRISHSQGQYRSLCILLDPA